MNWLIIPFFFVFMGMAFVAYWGMVFLVAFIDWLMDLFRSGGRRGW